CRIVQPRPAAAGLGAATWKAMTTVRSETAPPRRRAWETPGTRGLNDLVMNASDQFPEQTLSPVSLDSPAQPLSRHHPETAGRVLRRRNQYIEKCRGDSTAGSLHALDIAAPAHEESPGSARSCHL